MKTALALLLFGILFTRSILSFVKTKVGAVRKRVGLFLKLNYENDFNSQIYCNAELNADYIEAIGFDMDSTLVQVV